MVVILASVVVGLATAAYSNGLLVGEAISASLTIPWMLPLVHGNWRASLVAWSIPVFVIAALGMIYAHGRRDAAADAAVAERLGPAVDADAAPRFAGGIGEPLRVDADQRVKSFDRVARSLRDRVEHGRPERGKQFRLHDWAGELMLEVGPEAEAGCHASPRSPNHILGAPH